MANGETIPNVPTIRPINSAGRIACAWSMEERCKSQNPNPKLQNNPKLQLSKATVRFGIWDFIGIWILGFGIWVSLPLNGSRRFAGDVEADAVDPFDLVDDSAGQSLQEIVR